jgi:hypothetical protein
MTTTIATERIKEVSLRQGLGEFLITLDRVGEQYIVGACRLYLTYQGARVEGVKDRTFTDLNAAREYANGYYFAMRKRGWK